MNASSGSSAASIIARTVAWSSSSSPCVQSRSSASLGMSSAMSRSSSLPMRVGGVSGTLRGIYVTGNHWCQLFWSSQKHRRYCSSHWFVRSDCPSVLGWYAVEMFWHILSAWHNPLAYFDVNLVSQSEMIFFGTPNHG